MHDSRQAVIHDLLPMYVTPLLLVWRVLVHTEPTLIPFPGVDGPEAFEQPFDFSRFQNLQEVGLGVGWMNGSLHWIPRTPSTIKPATSPHLSVIQLSFVRPITANRSVRALVEDAGGDLRRVGDEIARIESEFEGVVDLTVVWDPSFRMALGAL